MPVQHERITMNSFQYLLDRVKAKLCRWKSKNLSLAGRIVLTKHVLSTMAVYATQTARIPLALCDEIDKVCQSFIWGQDPGERKSHLFGWDTICRPIDCDGLGIRPLRLVNKASLSKMGWRLLHERKSFGLKFCWQIWQKSTRLGGVKKKEKASASNL